MEKSRADMSRHRETLGSRLMAALFSLFVSVPTAVLIWLWINRELGLWAGGFIGSEYLLGTVLLFALVAFFAPRFFPSLLGWVWHGMASASRWWV